MVRGRDDAVGNLTMLCNARRFSPRRTLLIIAQFDAMLEDVTERLLRCGRDLRLEFAEPTGHHYFQMSPLWCVCTLITTVFTLGYCVAEAIRPPQQLGSSQVKEEYQEDCRGTALATTFGLAVAFVALPTVTAQGALTRKKVSSTLLLLWALIQLRNLCFLNHDTATSSSFSSRQSLPPPQPLADVSSGLFDWIQAAVICTLWLLPHALGLTSSAAGNFPFLVLGTLLAVTGLWKKLQGEEEDGGWLHWRTYMGILILHSPALLEQYKPPSSSNTSSISNYFGNCRRIGVAVVSGVSLLSASHSSPSLNRFFSPRQTKHTVFGSNISSIAPATVLRSKVWSDEPAQCSELHARSKADFTESSSSRDALVEIELPISTGLREWTQAQQQPKVPPQIDDIKEASLQEPVDDTWIRISMLLSEQPPLAAPTLTTMSSLESDRSFHGKVDLEAASAMPGATTAPDFKEFPFSTVPDNFEDTSEFEPRIAITKVTLPQRPSTVQIEESESCPRRDENVHDSSPTVPVPPLVVPRLFLSLSRHWAVGPRREPLVVTQSRSPLVDPQICALRWLLQDQVACSNLPLGLALVAFAVQDLAPTKETDANLAAAMDEDASLTPLGPETALQCPSNTTERLNLTSTDTGSLDILKLKITPDLLVGNWS